MFSNRVDGMLVSLAYNTTDLEHFNIFFKKHIPVIFFDRMMEQPIYTNVVIQNKKAAYEATSHLISHGCQNIVHITAIPKQNVYKDRLDGYRQALSDNNIKFDDKKVIIGNLSFEAGAAAKDAIMKMKELPDGVFVANDNCAVGCMLALKQAGISIPEDIAFVGFNNDPVSKVIEPNLTTINYPGYEMGEMAVRSLINHLGAAIQFIQPELLLCAQKLL